MEIESNSRQQINSVSLLVFSLPKLRTYQNLSSSPGQRSAMGDEMDEIDSNCISLPLPSANRTKEAFPS